MPDWLIHLIIQYKYLFLVIVAIFEGPVLMAFCGAFIKLGYLSLWPSFLALMIGDLIADTGWYFVGYFGGMKFVDRFGKYIRIDRDKIEIVSNYFHRYHNPILFISKITSGFGFALVTLVTAGIVRIPFRRYILLNGAGQFVWTGVLVGLGYLFGHLYITISDVLGRATIIVIFTILVIIVVGIGFHIHNKIEEGKYIN